MAAVDITRRRHIPRTATEAPGNSFFGFTDRPDTTTVHHQPLHHHHYNHYYYHHFLRQSGTDQDQGALMSSASTSPDSVSPGGSPPNNISQQRSSANRRMSFINYVLQLNHPQEAAMEASDLLDERIRNASNLSQRHRNVGFQGHFLHELSSLFEDDDDFLSDDEIWEIDMRDWLEAWGFEEGWHSDHLSTSEEVSISTGLTKTAIRNLHRQVFVPRGDKEVGDNKLDSSPQDDCCVCLEHFLPGQVLICLPCMHRFHPDCLSPWLESHGQCPYCRANVSCEGKGEASSSHHGVGAGGSTFLHMRTT